MHLFFFDGSHAQVKLSVDSALSIALKNNYDIIISEMVLKKAEQNADASVGNFMPMVFVNGQWQKNYQSLNQNFASGLEVDKDNVKSDALNASANLNWTLFDGMQMFANRNRLLAENEVALFDLKQQIENTVMSVLTAYYDVVRQIAIIEAQKSNLDVTQQRLDISTAKKEIGTASGLELMQAQIDLNNQKSELLRQQMNLQNSKAILTDLIAKNSDFDFTVTDSIVINYKPEYNDLRKTVSTQNNSILSATKNLKASEYFLKEMKAGYYPRLDFYAGYDFLRNKSEAGFLLKSDNSGINFGFSASWLLFNKLQTRNAVRQANLDIQISRTELEALRTSVDVRLIRAFNNYNAALEIVTLENENVSLAAEASQISLDRYKLGRSSILELKDAQNVFQITVTNYINALYAAKLNELELLRLNGELVK